MAYSEEEKTEIFDDICIGIVNGLSLRAILNQLGTIPAKTFFEWLREDESKGKQYARATLERSELMFEDMIDIADDSDNDFEDVEITEGVTARKFNPEHVQRSRLRVDTRKWALSKMNPKKYGDKLDVTTDGKEVNTQPTIIFKKFKNDE